MRVAVVAAGLTGIVLASFLVGRPDVAAGDADDAFRRDVQPFLQKWCFECHSGAKLEDGFDIAKLLAGPGDADAVDAWREVRKKLRRRAMPPKKAPQPTDDDVAKALACLDARAAAPHDADPGRVTLRRLSRFEYRRTVHDLLGVDFDAESRLPADEVTLGFDNIGDAMSLAPALLEKYVKAAEEIAGAAIVDEDPEHPTVRRLASTQRGWIEFYANGSTGAPLVLPRDGEYVVRARAYGLQAGLDPVRMAFRADGAAERVTDVDAPSDAPKVYEARLKIAGGTRRVSVAFINHYANPAEPDPARRERKLFVEWIEVVGPVDVRPVPAIQRRLFGDDAKRPRDRAFAREIVRSLADRAFRRPAADDEVDRLADVVLLAQKEGATFERGVQLALTTMLVSPHFLYRVETDPAAVGAPPAHDLTDYEIATRLSYFLWSSMPDDELFAVAAKGGLRSKEAVAAQARRMLSDPRAASLATNFAVQWLELRRLASAAPDPARFPLFDETLRAAMRRETEMFVFAVVREDRPLRDLLDADFTFVNERLAAHYGIAGVKGEQFQRVKLPPGARRGLLTQASILTSTSNPRRTSPVKRGKFILTEILGDPPAAPPPGVGAFDESDAAAKTATLRRRLEAHRADPRCASCHAKMDALGFALENFDAVGSWRDVDGTQPVDAAGTLPDGREIVGPVRLRAALLSDDSFARCLAEKLFIYALGRAPTSDDRREVDGLVDASRGLDATFADLVLGIVEMDGFRRRRGE